MATPAHPFPLALAQEGECVKVMALRAGKSLETRLRRMGLAVDSVVEVIARQPGGALVIGCQGTRLALGIGMAHQIMVIRLEESGMAQVLRDLAVGQHGRVVGFQQAAQAYKRKLLAMGLTPGTEFTVVRYAPLGDPIEILVRGFHLSLRQDEAGALQVEEIDHA